MKSFLQSEVSSATGVSSAGPHSPLCSQFLWADWRVSGEGDIALHSCSRRAWPRHFYHLCHSRTPRTQAVEGHAQLMGGALPALAPLFWWARPGHSWTGDLQRQRCHGERHMSSQLPPSPACPASAELSSRLQGLLRHAAPPGPAPHSPPRARNLFSQECQGVLRGLYFPGAQRAPESSRLCSWEGKGKIRGFRTPPCSPSSSHPHTDPTCSPADSFHHSLCEGKSLGTVEDKGIPHW